MIQKFYLQPWSSPARQMRIAAIFIASIWFVATLAFGILYLFNEEESAIRLFVIVTSGVVPILAFLLWLSRFRRGIELKMFHIPLATAVNVVGDILKEKGIPYQGKYREGRWSLATQVVFRLEQSNLILRISEQAYAHSPLTMIEMRPVMNENRPMVKSLQQKISQALLSHGLS
jgi:hypothetical protein